jgi:hypothetical protein
MEGCTMTPERLREIEALAMETDADKNWILPRERRLARGTLELIAEINELHRRENFNEACQAERH